MGGMASFSLCDWIVICGCSITPTTIVTQVLIELQGDLRQGDDFSLTVKGGSSPSSKVVVADDSPEQLFKFDSAPPEVPVAGGEDKASGILRMNGFGVNGLSQWCHLRLQDGAIPTIANVRR